MRIRITCILCRVNLDGSGMKLLNPGDYDNPNPGMNDACQFIVNNFSRVSTVPKSILYDNAVKIMDLKRPISVPV